jgi:stage II sporulation protein D
MALILSLYMRMFVTVGAKVAIALCLLSLPSAKANPSSLYVKLFQARPLVSSIFVRGPFVIVNPTRTVINDGVFEFTDAGRGIVLRKVGGKRQKEIVRAPYVVMANRGSEPLAIGPDQAHMRKYYGEITVKKEPAEPGKPAQLTALNLVDSFNYVSSVVGGETTPQFGKEALKAMAVLVYTRLAPKGKHPTVSDTTDEMVYLGAEHERPEVIDAVNEIDRVKLLYNGRPAQVFFHACCAGRTSDGVDIFGKGAKSLVYLKGVRCDYCKGSPLFGPTVKKIPAAIFEREIAGSEPKVLEKDNAERIVSAEISKGGRTEVLSGYQLWLRIGQKLGWDKAPGTRYEIKRTGSAYTIKSSGGGHGVGLCQWGAQGLSRQGKSHAEILKFYFPSASLERR